MKTSVVIGSTGLVGSNIIKLLSSNTEYNQILSIARSKQSWWPQKVTHIPFNSGDYTLTQPADIAICCLGTTMKKAGSKKAFQHVDFELVVDFAKKAKAAGINRFAVVSSIGANHKSSNYYLQIKGKAEEELKSIGFERLVIVRPSLLLGNRNEKRLGEDIGKILYSVFKFVFWGPLKKYRGIEAIDVAKAMIALTAEGTGTTIAESNILPFFSKEYDAR